MKHKFAKMTSLLLLIMFTATVQFGYTVQWSPEMRLTWDTSWDFHPSIAQTSDGRIWVVWHSTGTGNSEIFFRVYNESQVHPWSPDTQLTADPSDDLTPSIMAAANGKIWVVWSTNRTGNPEIFCKTSSDNGETWEPDMQLTNDLNIDRFPSITQVIDGKIWVVWSTNRTGNLEIFCKTSSDNGETWEPDWQLTNNVVPDWDPSIAQMSDGRIWVVWVRNDDLFYRIHNGFFWLDETQLTSDLSLDWHPSIMQLSNEEIWIVWDSDRVPLQTDLYYKTSSNNGQSWSTTKQLTIDVQDDLMPSVLQTTDETIWLVWTSSRLDNFDIYYKTDSLPDQHDVAIFSVTHNPQTTIVYEGTNVVIEVVAQNQGTKHESIQVNCYVNSTLIGNQAFNLPSGQLRPLIFTWDTTGFAKGNYIISANVTSVPGETDTADNTYINGMIFLTITGDVNCDGVVDASDLFDLKKAYGSDPSKPNWNPNCNFNGDNKVDTTDLFDLSENYGKIIL